MTDHLNSPEKTPGKIMVAMLGARRHYAVPVSLNQAGALEHFYTDICAVKGWPKYLRYIPKSFQPRGLHRLAGRVPEGLPVNKLTSFPEFGLSYAYRLSRAKSVSEQLEVFQWASKKFARHIDRRGFGDADTVYIFDHNGADLLHKARAAGLKTVVDVTIAPLHLEEEHLAHEREHYPGWDKDKNILAEADQEVLKERNKAAWELADVLICGSEYVRDSVVASGADPSLCKVVPYGVPAPRKDSYARKEWTGRLKVLTVGSVSLRKGTPYVFEAAKRLIDYASFRMVGKVHLQDDAAKAMARTVNLVGECPRAQMRQHYEWADVFLLPSLSEGSAAVVYEALSYGLPVICTFNTGSVVRDGVEGFLTEPRDVDAIVERLMQLQSSHTLRNEMSRMAHLRSQTYTVSHYGQALLSAISEETGYKAGHRKQ